MVLHSQAQRRNNLRRTQNVANRHNPKHPTIDSVTLTPYPANATSTLTANPTNPYDADGNAMTYTYQRQKLQDIHSSSHQPNTHTDNFRRLGQNRLHPIRQPKPWNTQTEHHNNKLRRIPSFLAAASKRAQKRTAFLQARALHALVCMC